MALAWALQRWIYPGHRRFSPTYKVARCSPYVQHPTFTRPPKKLQPTKNDNNGDYTVTYLFNDDNEYNDDNIYH